VVVAVAAVVVCVVDVVSPADDDELGAVAGVNEPVVLRGAPDEHDTIAIDIATALSARRDVNFTCLSYALAIADGLQTCFRTRPGRAVTAYAPRRTAAKLRHQ
jgi:hypothetical protein